MDLLAVHFSSLDPRLTSFKKGEKLDLLTPLGEHAGARRSLTFWPFPRILDYPMSIFSGLIAGDFCP